MTRNIIFHTILLLLIIPIFSEKPLLTLVSPNGGERLISGTVVPISWKYTDQSSMSRIIIVLYKNGTKFLTISESTDDSGTYLWKLPENLPSGKKYRIRIRSTGDLSLNDFSDGDFSIMSR